MRVGECEGERESVSVWEMASESHSVNASERQREFRDEGGSPRGRNGESVKGRGWKRERERERKITGERRGERQHVAAREITGRIYEDRESTRWREGKRA